MELFADNRQLADMLMKKMRTWGKPARSRRTGPSQPGTSQRTNPT
jgi:hypothetical protein